MTTSITAYKSVATLCMTYIAVSVIGRETTCRKKPAMDSAAKKLLESDMQQCKIIVEECSQIIGLPEENKPRRLVTHALRRSIYSFAGIACVAIPT